VTRRAAAAALVAALVLAAPPPRAASAQGAGQPAAPPAGADIFLASLDTRGGAIRVGAPTNITARAGYDNQPSFTPEGAALLYTSVREDGQADVWRHDLAARASSPVTRTTESEYSPTVVPGGGAISVVRVERDSTQRLWRFPLDGGEPALILDAVKPVGYHAWGDESTLLLFVLGDPASLVRADVRSGAATPVIENPGRSIQRIPGARALSFVRKRRGGDWVMRYDVDSATFTPIAPTLAGSEDHAWTPDGSLLMARGNRLFAWDSSGGAWREVARFDDPGMARITRLAVSPRGDWIALVGEPAQR
jgi:hypothetical protein